MKVFIFTTLLFLFLLPVFWFSRVEARAKNIRRLKPTPTSTPTPTPTPSPSVTPVAIVSGASSAFGLWDPTLPQYQPTGPQKYPTCSKAEHDKFFVLGPDGLKYPTWHPPVVTVSTGKKCTFGHEHGEDPTKYEFFDTIRRHFAFDANHDGIIDSTELAASGIPFGYVNQQLDMSSMGQIRHEDHVGHKIEYVNGEADINSPDGFGTSAAGGIVIPEKTNTANKWIDSGIKCYFFDKIHQGVHSPDALTNNVHEVIFHSKCTSTRPEYQSNESLISGLVAFGNTGEFTRFCGSDRSTIIKLGTDSNNAMFPRGEQGSMRNIGDRDCIEKNFLVPAGSWSSFPYEIWSGGITLRKPNGSSIASVGGGWEVLDSIRYYDTRSTNKISYMADTCYEVIGDRRMRGGACDQMTNYGQILGIKWNDTRSAFKGLHRGQYMNPPIISNSGGNTIWYTDVYGNNASNTSFAGSIKQLIPSVNATISFDHDPRNILRDHSDGDTSVHAPN